MGASGGGSDESEFGSDFDFDSDFDRDFDRDSAAAGIGAFSAAALSLRGAPVNSQHDRDISLCCKDRCFHRCGHHPKAIKSQKRTDNKIWSLFKKFTK